MKIINLKTGKVKDNKPKPVFCELCDTDIHSMPGGVQGKIGQLPVAFCGICITGIVNILMENQNQGR
tara:strand:- start:312 stop:512 length:201 start_codon:yes stop_codon:yes gene_type:complete